LGWPMSSALFAGTAAGRGLKAWWTPARPFPFPFRIGGGINGRC